MRRISTLLFLFLLVTGCGIKKNISYYENIGEKVLSLYEDLNYDKKGISKEDQEVISNYADSLSKAGTKINLTKYIIKDESYKTNEVNSEFVYVEDGICYINRENIIFEEPSGAGPNEPSIRLVCQGYYLDLFESDTEQSYNDIANTRKYGYRYLGYKKEESKYLLGYRSFYDGTTTIVELIIENDNLKTIKIKENQTIKFD